MPAARAAAVKPGSAQVACRSATPTAGIDPQELIDTRPYAREWHFHILNDRSLYGIPRKFNVGFDGAGAIAVLEDTNDIGFQAVEVRDGFGVAPGVWFRLVLGGITGHRDFGRKTGVVVIPAEATAVADAVRLRPSRPPAPRRTMSFSRSMTSNDRSGRTCTTIM